MGWLGRAPFPPVPSSHVGTFGVGERGIYLAGTVFGAGQPLPSIQQLDQPQHRHLPLRGPDQLDEFLRDRIWGEEPGIGIAPPTHPGIPGPKPQTHHGRALSGVAARQELVEGHPKGPDVGGVVEFALLEALHGVPGGQRGIGDTTGI